MTDAPIATDDSRAKRMKAASHAVHEELDAAITAARPFSSLDRYGRFLAVQHQFHRDIAALYDVAELQALLPDLPARRRLEDIAQDLVDIGAEAPAADAPAHFGQGNVDIPTALGWLYVAEGSNLGAAFLLKAAAALGLSEDRGARHLAAAPEGRGLHWRTFTAALDGPVLNADEEARAMAGVKAAFTRVRGLVDTHYADMTEA